MGSHPLIEAWEEKAALMEESGMCEDEARLEAARVVFGIEFANLTLAKVHIMQLKYLRSNQWDSSRMTE